MSVRLKALLVAFQVSFLMWAIIIYGVYSVYTAGVAEVDMIATASTR